LTLASANQKLPSEPAVIPLGPAPDVWVGYSMMPTVGSQRISSGSTLGETLGRGSFLALRLVSWRGRVR
jgi:hypothetical protein